MLCAIILLFSESCFSNPGSGSFAPSGGSGSTYRSGSGSTYRSGSGSTYRSGGRSRHGRTGLFDAIGGTLKFKENKKAHWMERHIKKFEEKFGKQGELNEGDKPAEWSKQDSKTLNELLLKNLDKMKNTWLDWSCYTSISQPSRWVLLADREEFLEKHTLENRKPVLMQEKLAKVQVSYNRVAVMYDSVQCDNYGKNHFFWTIEKYKTVAEEYKRLNHRVTAINLSSLCPHFSYYFNSYKMTLAQIFEIPEQKVNIHQSKFSGWYVNHQSGKSEHYSNLYSDEEVDPFELTELHPTHFRVRFISVDCSRNGKHSNWKEEEDRKANNQLRKTKITCPVL